MFPTLSLTHQCVFGTFNRVGNNSEFFEVIIGLLQLESDTGGLTRPV